MIDKLDKLIAVDSRRIQSKKSSKFHWLFMPGQTASNETYDTILEETDNFAVTPTKGSIVSGWVLVIPKFPISRIADIPEDYRNELNELVERISNKLMIGSTKPHIFEHGGFKGSKISCGVDQAHLHIVSLRFDLLKHAESQSPEKWLELKNTTIPNSSVGKSEYWFMSNGDTSKYKTIENPCSQFFRKIIAEQSGVAELWDYNSADFSENVNTTMKLIGKNG